MSFCVKSMYIVFQVSKGIYFHIHHLQSKILSFFIYVQNLAINNFLRSISVNNTCKILLSLVRLNKSLIGTFQQQDILVIISQII